VGARAGRLLRASQRRAFGCAGVFRAVVVLEGGSSSFDGAVESANCFAIGTIFVWTIFAHTIFRASF
jgi:hypothetical protein